MREDAAASSAEGSRRAAPRRVPPEDDAGVFGGSVYMRGGSAGFNTEGLAVVVGDDDTASRMGIRLPVRYSFSSLGFCAALSGVDGVAQAESASAKETIMRRCM